MEGHHIGPVEDFPQGEGTQVNVNGIDVAVFNCNGEFYGIQNLCTHQRLPLHLAGKKPYISQEGWEEEEYTRGHVDCEEKVVSCPFHRLRWRLEDGTSPATQKQIATYDLEVRNGEVYLKL